MTADVRFAACLQAKMLAMQTNFGNKTFQILHHFWNPKMVPELTFYRQNGVQKMAPENRFELWFDFLVQKLGPLFGSHFLAPFWGPNSGIILGFQKWCKIWTVLLPKFVCMANIFACKHAAKRTSAVMA